MGKTLIAKITSKRSRGSVLIGMMIMAIASFEANGLGAMETSVRDVGGFDSVILATRGDLTITQGDRESLEITARSADIANIVTEVRGGALVISWQGEGPVFSIRRPKFRLTLKTITALETRSSGKIAAASLRTESLRLRISSSGGISIDSLTAGLVDVQISSSGSCRLGGTVGQQNVRLSSSGNYLAANLASAAARVTASSSGSATLRVSDSLEANVTSSGNVRYYGSNPRVDGKVTSSGRLVRLGE